MRVIPMQELHSKCEKELCALFAAVSRELVRSERESSARRNALASLENIARARVARAALTP